MAITGGATTTITNTHDNNGSLVNSLSTTGGVTTTTTYAYNDRNKMVQYEVNGTVDANYVYDDAGNRVQETVDPNTSGAVTSYYLTDTNNPTGYAQPIETWTVTGTAPTLAAATLSLSYVIGSRVLAQVAGPVGTTPSPVYYLTDGHGSTRATANSSTTNNITTTFNYTAFGGAYAKWRNPSARAQRRSQPRPSNLTLV